MTPDDLSKPFSAENVGSDERTLNQREMGVSSLTTEFSSRLIFPSIPSAPSLTRRELLPGIIPRSTFCTSSRYLIMWSLRLRVESRTPPRSSRSSIPLNKKPGRTLKCSHKSCQSKGVKVQPYLRVGYPFDEIVLMANHFDVDLIIIGSHGRGGISRLLVGSTAERVVEHAPCPVLVVKESRRRSRSE